MSHVCPGCLENRMPDDCYHSEKDWELAEAMRDGIARLHSETPPWGSPTNMAWAFADDAEAVSASVGEPPYRIEFTHPGGEWTSLGLVNGKYLIGMRDGEGEGVMESIGDISALVKEPDGSES